MRTCVRAIVFRDDKLLVMHRSKFGEEYRTLVGGGIEEGETPMEALHRELMEETQLKIDNPRLVFIEHAGELYGDQYIFLCDYISGEPVLDDTSDEVQSNMHTGNIYKPIWMPLTDIDTCPFYSTKLKDRIIDAFQNGWPNQPVEFN